MSSIIKDKVKAKEIDSMEKINGESLDIVKENVKKLKELFPEAFTEEKIDFDRLQDVLGNYIDDKDEKYRFEWHGKAKAIKISQTSSSGTLRPCREESKNFDDTENLYIEGDNLEVLKLLQKSYQGKIKMIYIDPPYNTGNDFVYPDDYSDNLQNYLEITNQVNSDGDRVTTNSEVGGRYHTNWLNMMYPRLRLAKNLLSDDGVIFISIDDHEQENLKKICNEILGESNFIAELIWERAYSPKNDAKYISNSHDYLLMYAKAVDLFQIGRLPRTEEANARYKNIDNDPRGPWKPGDMSVKTYNSSTDYPITVPSGRIVEPPTGRCWRASKESYERLVADNRIYFGADGNNVPQIKRFLSELKLEGMAPTSILFYKEVGHSQEGAKEVTKLLEAGAFDGPKPVRLMKRLLTLANLADDSLVLDFFSGSASTAHAIMEKNFEDSKHVKFIMVQLPEECDKKSEAYKAGYKNICEIGKERIRRAGDKILGDNKGKECIDELDVGFKVFKLDTSNIKSWNPDYDNLEKTLEDTIDNFVPYRSEDDVVYEIMLKYGIDLTYPIETKVIGEKKIFSIGFGALLICLDDDITLDEVNDIVKLKDELKPKTCRVVFKDNGFKTDSVKANAIETLRRNNIKEIMSI